MGPCFLIVDDDVGFAFWLAHVLDSAGCQAFPAREVESAFILLRDVPALEGDLRAIIISAGQNGADHLISHCREQCPDLAVVWLYDAADKTHDNLQDAWQKPSDRSPQEYTQFLVGVGRLLARLSASSRSA